MVQTRIGRRTALSAGTAGVATMLLPAASASASVVEGAAVTTTTVSGAGGSGSPETTGWTSRATTETSANYVEVAYGSGTYVALASAGSFLVSSDGITWSSYSNAADDVPGTWYDVAYGEPGGSGRFVAVCTRGGTNGTLKRAVYSSDGTSWTIGTTPSSSTVWTGVTWGGGQYVACGYGVSPTHELMTSTDGITWTGRGTVSGSQLNAVCHGTPGGSDLYVAVGLSGTIATSPDGVTWTNRTGPSITFRDVVYGGGTFVAVGTLGGIATSTNGTDWTDRSTGDRTLNGVTYASGTFVAVGSNSVGTVVVSSTNGISWTTETSPAETLTSTWNGVTYGGGKFVAVGTASTGSYIMTNP